MELYQIYTPITAAPFAHHERHTEISPCSALKPYVRCFWGSEWPYKAGENEVIPRNLVTPDTCMDIIFTVNETKNRIDSSFSGIDDRAFQAGGRLMQKETVSTFAIRFYAWSAVLFSEDSLKHVRNTHMDAGQLFSRLKKDIGKRLFDAVTLRERIAIAEKYLLAHMRPGRENRLVMEGVSAIVRNRGQIKIAEAVREIHISSRQMERVFLENIGISPKKLASLVRYQYLWKDILYQDRFDIQDAVFKYGYTDQAHLLKDFKRFHTLSPGNARQLALQHVAFLQAGEPEAVLN